MSDWDAHERQMRQHQGRGPAKDPRGPHHHTLKRWLDLESLCEIAESRAVQVHLAVSDRVQHEGDEARERRDLDRLTIVTVGGRGVATRKIVNGNIDSTARELIEVLA